MSLLAYTQRKKTMKPGKGPLTQRVLNTPPPCSFEDLRSAFMAKASAGVMPPGTVAELSQAIKTNAFRAGFVFEPIYGRKRVMAYEALARPRSNGQDYPIQRLADQMYDLGLSVQLDTLSVANALREARRFPMTINISASSALSEDFWNALMPRIAKFDPAGLIFEILEHEIPAHADITALQALKPLGYRFALDDYAPSPLDDVRLNVFGPCLDFIKIEGACLQQLYVQDPKALKSLAADLKIRYPSVQLIAEHVKHFDQAALLFDLGFDGVQGRALREEDYLRTILGVT